LENKITAFTYFKLLGYCLEAFNAFGEIALNGGKLGRVLDGDTILSFFSFLLFSSPLILTACIFIFYF
jgi:hypothetical protein